MTKFKSQKDIVETIALNLNDLEAGNLSLEALEGHCNLVRELYERTIVLRYKAFENSIEKIVVEVPQMLIEEASIETKIDPIQMQETASMFNNKNENEEPAIEFSLFDEDEDPEIDDENEKEIIDIPVAQPIIETTEPLVNQVIEEQTELHKIEEVQEPVSPADSGKFLRKFQSIENELTNQLGFSKLQTLVGSFGLNERLQYINELFDGSSEVFSDAIKSLDVLPNINTAKSLTADLAIQNNWDVESDTVEEFIQKICRRYA